MKRLLTFAVLCCLLPYFKASAEEKVLAQGQMVDILVDLELAKAGASSETTDKEVLKVLFLAKAKHIYQNHDVEEISFKYSYLHYLAHPEGMLALYEQVITKLELLLTPAQ
jgi:hypothetical protein